MGNKSKSRYYQLVSNTFIFALGNFGSKFLVFLLLPLYTNSLSTSEYGISEILVTATNFIIPIVSVSIQDATLRFALDKRNNGGEVIKNTVVVLMIGSLLSCLLYPVVKLYPSLADWSGFFVAISICYMIRNAFSIYIKAAGKTMLFAVDSILYTAMLMVSNIVFLTVFKWGIRGYFYAIIVSSFFSIVFLVANGHIIKGCRENKINKALLWDMIKFSLPMILNNISWWIINSSDKIMIEHFLSAGDSGIYSVAAKMPSLIAAITNIFNQAWVISSVSEYDTTRDSNFFTNIFDAFNTIIIMFASAVIFIIKPFMHIYVGASFISCWQYVPLLLLGSIFQAYATFFGAIYTSAKKNVSVMLTTFLAAGINIFLNTILIIFIGIQGAVIATAVAYLIVFIFRMVDSQKYVRFHIDFFRVGFSIVVLTIQCIFTVADIYPFLISGVCIIVLLFINQKAIKTLINKSLSKVKHKNI